MESLLGLLPIEAEIEARKLLFLGRLCRMNYRLLPKQIFLTRLFSFQERLADTQYGFIPDIYTLLEKIDLLEYVRTWQTDGSFPSKLLWKNLVRKTINKYFVEMRTQRMLNDLDFSRFIDVFQNDATTFWKNANNCYEISLCKFIAKLCSVRPANEAQICMLCQNTSYDILAHAVCACVVTYSLREEWWNTVFDYFDVNLCAELCALQEDDLFHVLLGRPIGQLSDSDTRDFQMCCY